MQIIKNFHERLLFSVFINFLSNDKKQLPLYYSQKNYWHNHGITEKNYNVFIVLLHIRLDVLKVIIRVKSNI